ncbi:oxidoreductase [Microbacterium saccharophilum]|nr:oxidoreductase [Microbacterium saccharophilum]
MDAAGGIERTRGALVFGMTRIGHSDLDIFPLALGGNVFGWTADRDTSFAVLDAFREGGGDFLDTADSYSSWKPGNSGGESETIIGEWLASRKPAGVVVATKVSQHPEFKGLSGATVRAAAEASLRRLGVDAIDLYYAHFDDESVPLEETVAAFGALVADGLVRHTAVSNYSAERIQEWIRIARNLGVAEPIAVQPHYNLVHRGDVEEHIVPVAQEHGLSLVPYFALAKGFLTGKYRTTDVTGQSSPRATAAAQYATPAGLRIIDALERIGDAHGVSIAATALAWLRAQPSVAAPIASASQVAQVADLLDGARTDLDADEVFELNRVSEWTPATA